MGRTVVVAAVALLIGVFVGGVGPRRELSTTRKELESAKAAAARGGSAAALPFALGVGSLMAAQERARAQEAAEPRAPRPETFKNAHPLPEDGARAATGGGIHEGDATDAGSTDAGRRRFGFGDEQSFAAAKAAADLRAAQYRAAFFDEAHLAPEKRAGFDDTIRKMNDDLGKVADEVAQSVATGPRKMSSRDVADIGARVLDIYRSTDDRFKTALDDDGRAALEKTDFDILTQIDLSAFRRLGDTMQSWDGPPSVRR